MGEIAVYSSVDLVGKIVGAFSICIAWFPKKMMFDRAKQIDIFRAYAENKNIFWLDKWANISIREINKRSFGAFGLFHNNEVCYPGRQKTTREEFELYMTEYLRTAVWWFRKQMHITIV